VPDFPAPFSVPVALSRRSHEVVGGRRTDEGWLAERWSDPATRVLVLAGGRFPLTHDGRAVRWVTPAEAPAGERLLLGEYDGVVHVAVVARDVHAPDDWGMLRTVGPLLTASDAGLVVQAQALAEWHRAHRFCSWCGAGLLVSSGGYVLRCEGCGRQHFPRTDPAVIMLVTDGERALLGRQAAWPPGRFSTIAGFVDPGETLEQAVVREVREETGIEVGEVGYFGNQPWPFPASLMVGFFAEALSDRIEVDGDELEAARWFTRAELLGEAEAGTLKLPSGISISRSLIEAWYGGPLPGSW
jgi:NAD+ diphosphatase